MEFDDNRIAYLQMVENIIDRMSNKSGNIKNFAVSIVAGVTALSVTETNPYVLLLSFVPIIIFLWLNLYYLSLERKYRFLYEQIRNGKPVNFDLSLDLKQSEIKTAKAFFLQCMCSKTIYAFYIPLSIIVVIILIFKFKGII